MAPFSPSPPPPPVSFSHFINYLSILHTRSLILTIGFTNPDPYSEGSHLEEGDPNEDGADQDEDEDDDEARERARLLAEFHDAKDALQELKDERDRRRAQDEVLLDIILARRRRPFVLRSCRNWRRWIARRVCTTLRMCYGEGLYTNAV